jgi:hypothetical protein
VTLDSLLAHRATGRAASQTATSGVRRVIWRHDQRDSRGLPQAQHGFSLDALIPFSRSDLGEPMGAQRPRDDSTEADVRFGPKVT